MIIQQLFPDGDRHVFKKLEAGELGEHVHLTVGGVVKIGNFGYMHPYAFREMYGELAYDELLSRPRVICEYDYDDDIKDGETVCEHGNRPFDCNICRPQL